MNALDLAVLDQVEARLQVLSRKLAGFSVAWDFESPTLGAPSPLTPVLSECPGKGE